MNDISIGSGSYDPGINPWVREQWKYRLMLKLSTRE